MQQGQDVIEAEIKGSNKRLAFTNTAKITLLANKFPRVNDQTAAFKERRLFLNFPQRIHWSKPNTGYRKKLAPG
jgi:phage/plasmid-associated DNA primase